MRHYKSDPLDLYRLKMADTEKERIEAMEAAIEKAVERAQINYLLMSLVVAVLMVVLVQSLTIMDINPLPAESYKWCILVMVLLVVLPWQLRNIRALILPR